mmetsp:Transcript_4165/g.8570  ORF Transcript_4165/g.8570 Transcript_4165/m.8570 type:complete len:275 (+) Transcript_4165:466-1290(+)
MFCEIVYADPLLDVPDFNRRIERSTRQDQVLVGIVGVWACRAPLDGVDLLGMAAEIVNAGVLLEAPDFRSLIIRAGSQECASRIPLDGVHLVFVSLELLQVCAFSELADVNHLVCTTSREGYVVPPINIQSRSCVVLELLLDLASLRIPDYSRVVDATAKQVVTFLVPLQGKDGTFVLVQSVFQFSVARPDARLAIVRPGSKQAAVAVPIKGCHILALFLLVLHIPLEVFERNLLNSCTFSARAIPDPPDACSGISGAGGKQRARWAPRADEHF